MKPNKKSSLKKAQKVSLGMEKSGGKKKCISPAGNAGKRKVETVLANGSEKRIKLNFVTNAKKTKAFNGANLLKFAVFKDLSDDSVSSSEDHSDEHTSTDSGSESDGTCPYETAVKYSVFGNSQFLRNPQVVKLDKSKKKHLELKLEEVSSGERSETTQDDFLFQEDLGEIEGTVTKVQVFEGMLPVSVPEPEPEVGTIIKNVEEQLEHLENTETMEPILSSVAEDLEPDLNIFENSLNSNAVLAVLKQDTEFYGTFIVTLLSGRITINGYKAPHNVPLTVYSPKGFNWVNISTLANKKLPKGDLNWEQLEETFTRAQVERLMAYYDKAKDAVVVLQRNSGAQKLIGTFSKHMSENVFPLVNATNRPHYPSEYLLNCLVQRADKSKALQVPKVWTKLPLNQESRFILTGGKGVGKSTLLRYLLNRYLEKCARVLVIDLDIGQPELFVPQTVSCTVVDTPLLGPGLFLNKQPDIAFVVGHVDVVMCAEQYARAVRKLLAYCWESPSLKGIPWLVNTMGYNKGLGMELMALIVDCVEPTDLVQIYSTKAINNFDEPLDRQSLSKVVPMMYVADEFKLRGTLPKYTLHHLMCAVPQSDSRNFKRWIMSARDVRYSNLLARLSATLHGNAKYITDCQPVQVALDALQIVHITAVENTRKELVAGMEANMVYLCKRSSAEQPVECVGLGVVRSIDYKSEKVYMVPAMPFDRLTKVNCLVIGGGICLPQGFFKDQGASVANKVPFVFVIDDSKSSKSVQQIYHRAPGFLGDPAHKNVKQQ